MIRYFPAFGSGTVCASGGRASSRATKRRRDTAAPRYPALACVSAALALGGCWQTNEYPYSQYIQSNCTSPRQTCWYAKEYPYAQHIQSSCTSSRQACWYANEYPWAQYGQRTQTISIGAGNAQQANAATQVIDPWNRNVSNSRIPGNGDRMVNAMRLYRTPGGATGVPGGPGSTTITGTTTTTGTLVQQPPAPGGGTGVPGGTTTPFP